MNTAQNQIQPSTKEAEVPQHQVGTLKPLQATQDLAEPLGTDVGSSTGLSILFWLFRAF